jgi:hypothetical protein
MKFRNAISTGLASALLGAVPAQAVVTTFGTSASGATVRFQNNGGSSSVFSVASPGGTTPASANVAFSYTNTGIDSFVTAQPATFTLNATTTNGAEAAGPFFILRGFSGSFSFTNDAAIQIGDTTYSSGSNLLTATFTNANIFGQDGGTTASFTSTTLGTANFTSDFLDFGATTVRDFAFSLASVSPALDVSGQGDLASFEAGARGSFSSDPAPTPTATVTAVPEPATWAMLIAGFGMAGMALRRAKKPLTADR